MDRTLLTAFAILAVALSMTFASDTEAENSNSPVGGARESVVWAWGSNYDGELGSFGEFHTPTQVQNLSGITAIAAGAGDSLALKNDGTVWAWGVNNLGQLGRGTDGPGTGGPIPRQVLNLSGVTAIAAGLSHSLAVGPPPTQLTVNKILVHPDHHHLRLFNLQVDGVTVRVNINSGSSGPLTMSPGNHTVGEIGGSGTLLGAFTIVIGGDCAANGAVNLAPGDHKICTITNYDTLGDCPSGQHCCGPGEGQQECQRCISDVQECQ
ncbi:MAG: hypothetical protein USCAAHI_01249 [Beijerinckiaceae bacterium]|nr:MAG: hypothetical protein USCAAHI_01249 [Beijerinckiaceae bacterium]